MGGVLDVLTDWLSKDYDEKKNSYCYATELLEDYLY